MAKYDEKGNYNRFQKCILGRGKFGGQNLASHNLTLKTHFEICSRNASYRNPIIDKEIISTCRNIMIKKIVSKINKTKCFSILADKASDISGIK